MSGWIALFDNAGFEIQHQQPVVSDILRQKFAKHVRKDGPSLTDYSTHNCEFVVRKPA